MEFIKPFQIYMTPVHFWPKKLSDPGIQTYPQSADRVCVWQIEVRSMGE